MKWFQAFTLLVLTGLSALPANAGQKTVGDYEFHYSVFNSMFVQPEVARHYGIVRAKDNAVLNIAVRKKLPDGGTKAQRAMVSGSSSDLVRRYDLTFKEVEEQDAIYYLAQFRHGKKETRDFRLQIQPDPNAAPYRLEFNDELFQEQE